YSGDGISYNGSVSNANVSVLVTKGNPTPGVVAPSNTGPGVSFFLQTFIGNGVGTILPTGTVQFLDGGLPVGSPVTVSSNGTFAQASTQVTLTTLGVHNIQAQYSGDSIYNGVISFPAAAVTVGPFGFTANATTQTIAAGQTATYQLTLNQLGGFAGQVSF